MIDKIESFISKLIFIPIAFFIMYTYTIVVAEKLIEYIGYDVKNLNGFISCIVLSSVIAFLFTFILHIVSTVIWENAVYIKWFKYTNIVYLYISGLYSAIDTMQPLLVKEGIIKNEFNVIYKMTFLLFFIALFNYTFYENFIMRNFDFNNLGFVNASKRHIKNIINFLKREKMSKNFDVRKE